MELEGSKTRGQSSLNGPTVPAGNYAAVLTECVHRTTCLAGLSSR
jgi:hypothetical protein